MTGTTMGVAQPAKLLTSPAIAAAKIVSVPHSWLDDQVIDHAQALLKQQHPHVSGLYAVGSISLLGSPAAQSYPLIQIIHLGGNHWVTISNIGCSADQIFVYDSLVPSSNSTFTSQISSFLKSSSKSIQLVWPSVSKQYGTSDCGLFAIANATALCQGLDPASWKYDQPKMRAHLLLCYFNSCMSSFPGSSRGTQRDPVKVQDVPIYCSCRRPHRQQQEEMIECNTCSEWYHEECARVIASQYKTKIFTCQHCSP